MLTLPNAIVPVLNPFATLFRNPTDRIASTKNVTDIRSHLASCGSSREIRDS